MTKSETLSKTLPQDSTKDGTKTRKFKDPYSSQAWFHNHYAPAYYDKLGHKPKFGGKESAQAKRVFKAVAEMDNLEGQELFEVVDKYYHFFLDKEEFNWISLRDIASFAGNIYRVRELFNEYNETEENEVLDVLYQLEQKLLKKAPLEIQGSTKVLSRRASGGELEEDDL